MPQKAQKKTDPLVYVANLIGLAMLAYILLSALVRLLGGLVLQGAFDNVTLSTIHNAPEWALGIYNLILPPVILLPPYFLLKQGTKKLKITMPMGKSRLRLVLLVPLFLGAMVAVNSVSSMVAGIFGKSAAQGKLPQTAVGIVLYFVYTCILPAVLEELLFRGMIQGLLRPWGPRFAIIVSSAFFALLHANLPAVVAIFLLSVLLGYAREITGSVKPCIVLHLANNLSSFVMLLGQAFLSGVAALAFGFWVTLLFMVVCAAAAWTVYYFKQLPKFRLAKDRPNEPGRAPNYKRLASAQMFVAGLAGTLLFFIISVMF